MYNIISFDRLRFIIDKMLCANRNSTLYLITYPNLKPITMHQRLAIKKNACLGCFLLYLGLSTQVGT